MSWIYDTPSFFSSDFTDESEGSLAYRITHGFSRIFGRWPMGSRQICAAVVFGHADFADDADFSSWDYFCPTDFTDLHRFFSSEGFSSDFTDESEGILAYRITHGFSRIFGRWPMARTRYVLLLFLVTQISQMTQIFLRGIILSHRFHRYTQIFFIGRFFIGFHG